MNNPAITASIITPSKIPIPIPAFAPDESPEDGDVVGGVEIVARGIDVVITVTGVDCGEDEVALGRVKAT
jgi:hypothetical protein